MIQVWISAWVRACEMKNRVRRIASHRISLVSERWRKKQLNRFRNDGKKSFLLLLAVRARQKWQVKMHISGFPNGDTDLFFDCYLLISCLIPLRRTDEKYHRKHRNRLEHSIPSKVTKRHDVVWSLISKSHRLAQEIMNFSLWPLTPCEAV